tara:strand:+ start:475 stop:720 length:246 start_codon:yes stop_codon:yes gene_type:complete
MTNKLYTVHITLDEVIALRKARDITLAKFKEMKKSADPVENYRWETLPHNDTRRDLNALVDKVNEEVYNQYQNELKAKEVI